MFFNNAEKAVQIFLFTWTNEEIETWGSEGSDLVLTGKSKVFCKHKDSDLLNATQVLSRVIRDYCGTSERSWDSGLSPPTFLHPRFLISKIEFEFVSLGILLLPTEVWKY